MLILLTPQGLIDLDADPATWGAPKWLEICRALGRINRWSGNTCRGYTVAEHSLRVAAIVPHDLRLAALIHDAAEAFIGDVPAPIRRAGCGVFDNYDSKISAWLFNSCGILHQLSAAVVWSADQTLAATEFRDLIGGDPSAVGMAVPLEARIPSAVWHKTDPGDQLAAEIFKRLK